MFPLFFVELVYLLIKMEILTCKRTLFLYDCGDIEIFLLNEKIGSSYWKAAGIRFLKEAG